MRGVGALATVVGCAALLVSTASAEQKRPRLPLGTNPHPVIWGGMKTHQPAAPNKPAPPRPDHSHQQHHSCHPHCSTCRWSGYYFLPYDYGWYYYPWPYPLYVPPVLPPPLPPDDAVDEQPRPQRATNAQSVALGWKFIGYGDARFAKGDFAGAAERYGTATRNAPQSADAWMRRGFALAAVGRYDLAARHMRRGLQLDPKWPSAAADLRTLFAADAQAMRAHLDALREDAAERPFATDVLFVVGVHLYCAGQREEAEQFFRRAQNVAGGDDDHIRAFLGR
jgi:tetratricopeptide (TPR) repeat protein